MDKTLSKEQINRQDFVDNTIFQLINELNPTDKGIEWNIEEIGYVRDCILHLFLSKNLCKERDFYPYMEE